MLFQRQRNQRSVSNLHLQKEYKEPGELNEMQIPGPPLTDIWLTRSGMNPEICIFIKPTGWIKCFTDFNSGDKLFNASNLGWNIFNLSSVWVSNKWAYTSSKGTFISLRVEALFMLLYEMNLMLNLGHIEQFLSPRHCLSEYK